MPERPGTGPEYETNAYENFHHKQAKLLYEMSTTQDESKLVELARQRKKLFAQATDEELAYHSQKLAELLSNGPSAREIFEAKKIEREQLREDFEEFEGQPKEGEYDATMKELDEKTPEELRADLDRESRFSRTMGELEASKEALWQDLLDAEKEAARKEHDESGSGN